MAGSIYGALAAGGARPVPVNLSLPGPVDQRLAPLPVPQGQACPKPSKAPAPSRKSSKRRGATGQKPAKPQPKTSAPRPPTNNPNKDGKTKTTLTHISRKDKK